MKPDIPAVDTIAPGGSTAASEGRSAMMACGMGAKGPKGLFLMATCCAASLLLLLAFVLLSVRQEVAALRSSAHSPGSPVLLAWR